MSTLSILLIEDDEDDVFFFCDVLKEINIEVSLHHTLNGLEAMKYMNRMKHKRPQLIFTDLNMPLMSGWEFLKQIKTNEDLRDIPIIVLSTASDSETRKQLLDMGASSFFTKPPTVEAMKNIVERALEVLQENNF